VTLSHADSFYSLSYILDYSSTTTTLSVTIPSNSTFSVQLDKRLITVHYQRVIVILPCLGTIWMVVLPQKSDNFLTPSVLTSYRSVQVQRVIAESTFVTVFNKPSTLLFMEANPQTLWCSSSDLCELNRIDWSISEIGINTEEHGMDSCNQFAIDLRSFLSSCFPSSQIIHFEYWILQSRLCYPCCPSSHFTVAFAVATSKRDSKRMYSWLCVEFHLHPTSASPEWSVEKNVSEIYATVLDIQSEGSPKDNTSIRDACMKILTKRVSWLVKRLHCSESGKPIEYVLKEPSEEGMRFLVNTAFDDILVTSL